MQIQLMSRRPGELAVVGLDEAGRKCIGGTQMVDAGQP